MVNLYKDILDVDLYHKKLYGNDLGHQMSYLSFIESAIYSFSSLKETTFFETIANIDSRGSRLKDFIPNLEDESLLKLILKNAVLFEMVFDYRPGKNSVNEDFLEKAVESMFRVKKRFFMLNIKQQGGHLSTDSDGTLQLHKILRCLQKVIPLNRVILVIDDLHMEKRCKEIMYPWFNDVNVIEYPFYFLEQSMRYGVGHDTGFTYDRGTHVFKPHVIQKYKNRKKLPTKKFMCLMGIQSQARTLFYSFYKENNLMKDNYISYIYEGVVLPDSWRDPNEVGPFAKYQSGASVENLTSYYEDSYFTVLHETSNWEVTTFQRTLSFTEKLSKVLYHGHPFILLSQPGALRKLKEWGFETFPELFDESYDYKFYGSPEEKIEFVKKEILRLVSMDDNKLYDLCESVRDKCIHNQDIFMKLEVPRKELYDKLNKIFNE